MFSPWISTWKCGRFSSCSLAHLCCFLFRGINNLLFSSQSSTVCKFCPYGGASGDPEFCDPHGPS